jgi:hypothetical protein
LEFKVPRLQILESSQLCKGGAVEEALAAEDAELWACVTGMWQGLKSIGSIKELHIIQIEDKVTVVVFSSSTVGPGFRSIMVKITQHQRIESLKQYSQSETDRYQMVEIY